MSELHPWLLAALAIGLEVLSIVAAGHALLTKRNPTSALVWVAVCMMFPLAGPASYLLFGINRVRTRARELGMENAVLTAARPVPTPAPLEPSQRQLARISRTVTQRPLVGGNDVQVLNNAEQAYPAMLQAIEGAREQVLLASYIFDADASGRAFVEALARAHARGVDVRVIVDGFGELYSFTWVSGLLQRRGVPVTRFLRPRLLPPSLHVNLRNHRKILVTDRKTGFTGGMNISDRHWVNPARSTRPVADLHFRLRGPIAAQLADVFIEDWGFCTGKHEPAADTVAASAGAVVCRAIKDGPNEDLEQLSTIMLGAIGAARRKLAIVTPYFLPTSEMISALSSAALRGVEVTVVLPERSNLVFVDWATRNLLGEPLARGVKVFLQQAPFAHSKLFLVDDHYAQIGSANIDPRSLRLNFELAVENFDTVLARTLWNEVTRMLAQARPLTGEEIAARSLGQRLRDALAWLATPYL